MFLLLLKDTKDKDKAASPNLCSSQGSPEDVFYPGVHGAVDPPRSISNSGVKRSSGNDSWGAAPCENSSMPGKTFTHQQSIAQRSCLALLKKKTTHLGGFFVPMFTLDPGSGVSLLATGMGPCPSTVKLRATW